MKFPDKFDLEKNLKTFSIQLNDQAGRNTFVIKDNQARELALKSGKNLHDIYTAAFEQGIMPYRYIRNHDSISVHDQFKLFDSCAGVIGAGGLGGQIILNLARTGIGHLIIVDSDVFDETNLNRQALSSNEVIGRSKAQTALSAVNSINPGVDVKAYQIRIDKSNGTSVLAGSDIIVDALDNVSDRFILEDAAKALKIPLVHGAVAGFEGQVMTIFPEDEGLESIYGKDRKDSPPENDPVAILGVPAATPAVIASLQTMEVVKVLLGKGQPLRNRLAHFDIESLDLRKFSFKK